MSASSRAVVGIIPARGGSKGVPRKNVRPLCGRPLIAWTIAAAQKAASISRTIVSTDDAEIAAVARDFGAEVVIRPAEIAGDTTPTEPALLHVLDHLRDAEGYDPDAIALLQCTSPLRGSDIIDAGVDLLFSTDSDAILTVCPMQHWYLCGQITQDGVYAPEYDYNNRPFSQSMPHKVRENGALYVTRVPAFRRFGNRLGGTVRALIMDPARSVDIDTEADFALAEQLMTGIRPA